MAKAKQVSFPKSKIKILLLENIHPDAVALLRSEGFIVESLSKSLGEDELCEKIKDVSILGIRSKTEVTKKVLEKHQISFFYQVMSSQQNKKHAINSVTLFLICLPQ